MTMAGSKLMKTKTIRTQIICRKSCFWHYSKM